MDYQTLLRLFDWRSKLEIKFNIQSISTYPNGNNSFSWIPFFLILKELLFHPVILYVPNSHRIFSGILHIFLFFIYPFVLHPCHQILNRCLCLQIFKTEHLLWMCCPASHVGFLSSNTSVFHLKLEHRETHPQHTHHPPNELHWDTHTRVSSRHMLYSAV